MSIWAVMRVKDEADIIGSTVTWALEQVDRVLIEDNASTDGTLDILDELRAEHPERVYVRSDDEVGYWQSERMSALAREAAAMGAEWVVPVDADEAWSGPDCTVGDWLADMGAEVSIVRAALYDHVASGADDATGDPLWDIEHRRVEPAGLPKVAVRARPFVVIHQGNHGADYGREANGLVVHHYPYRSPEQMIRKARNGAAAYAATDLPEDVGKHWRDYGRLSDEQIADTFRAHFWSPDGLGLVPDRPRLFW